MERKLGQDLRRTNKRVKMAYDKISGVYCIYNTKSKKAYFGSSSNMKKRLNAHLNMLRRNTHENSHLQNSFNLYGEDFLEFNIIEECNSHEVLQKEESYIRMFWGLGVLYNKVQDALKPPVKPKAICAYNKEGGKVKDFPSITQAAETLGIDTSFLSAAVKGKKRTASGYFWAEKGLKPVVRLPDFQKIKPQRVRVWDGKTQTIFKTVDKAAVFLGVNGRSVRKTASGTNKTCKKYSIEYLPYVIQGEEDGSNTRESTQEIT